MPNASDPSNPGYAAAESRWEQLFEQSPLSLQIFSPDGRTIRFNPAWKRLFGLSDEEAYAFNVLESPDLIESGAVHLIRKAFAGEVVFVPPVPFPVRGNPHSIRWIGGTVFPVITPDGILREVVVVHHDITELKEAEETMRRLNEILEERVASRTAELRASEENLRVALDAERQINRLKTAFAGMVSHEFRTPLGIISTATEILARYHDRLDAPQRARHTSAILDAVRRMTAMMDHILLLAGIGRGKSSVPVETDLADWLTRTLGEIRRTCPSRDLCPNPCATDTARTECLTGRDIRLVIDPDPALRRARIDVSLLHHIVGNLFSNACKYSPAGRLVEISLLHTAPGFTLSVRDQGIGIPADEQPRLFDGFFRGANAGDVPGTGLGLAITRRCVEVLGGRIDVESRPGGGSTFTVTLPLAPP